MRWFFGSLLFAGSLKAAKSIGSVVPGPRTSGWPIVAAEALPASAPVPATAAMAAIEAVRRIVVERFMAGSWFFREAGSRGPVQDRSRPAPPGGPTGRDLS